MDNNTSENNPQQSSNTNQSEQNPVKPAEVRLAGNDNTQFVQPYTPPSPSPAVVPPSAGMGYNMSPQKPRGKLAIIIIGVLFLVLGISAIIFYFAYWINPNVVFSRFQANSEKILIQAFSGQINLANGISYEASLKSPSRDNPIVVDSSGRNIEESSESSTKITYKNAPLTIDLRQPKPSAGKIDFYIKYQGLNKFLNNAFTKKEISSFGVSTAGVQKYENKWLVIGIDEALSSLDTSNQNQANSTASEDQINQADIKELSTKLSPIVAKSISGTDKKTALFSYDKPKAETVNGIASYAYKLNFNKANYQKMLESLSSVIDQTNLTQKKKDQVKDFVSSELENSKDESVGGDVKTTITIWLDRNTSLPVQTDTVVETSTAKIDFGNTITIQDPDNGDIIRPDEVVEGETEVTNITRFKTTITAFNLKQITASYIISSEDPTKDNKFLESTGTLNSLLDGSQTVIENKSTYKADKTSKEEIFEAKLSLKNNQNSNPIEKPASATKLDDAIKQIFK